LVRSSSAPRARRSSSSAPSGTDPVSVAYRAVRTMPASVRAARSALRDTASPGRVLPPGGAPRTSVLGGRRRLDCRAHGRRALRGPGVAARHAPGQGVSSRGPSELDRGATRCWCTSRADRSPHAGQGVKTWQLRPRSASSPTPSTA
jgi:hypothetical protein